MGKFIALDIGGVCFNINHDNCVNAIMELKNPDLIGFQELYYKHESGELESSKFLSSMAELSGYDKTTINNLFSGIIAGEIPGIADIISGLAEKGYKIAFLSDTSPIHLNVVKSKLSFADLIAGGVYSFEVGALKPDASMYREFEKRYGIPALYIDDKTENCAAAEKIGWNSYCFDSVDNLKIVSEKLAKLK